MNSYFIAIIIGICFIFGGMAYALINMAKAFACAHCDPKQRFVHHCIAMGLMIIGLFVCAIDIVVLLFNKICS